MNKIFTAAALIATVFTAPGRLPLALTLKDALQAPPDPPDTPFFVNMDFRWCALLGAGSALARVELAVLASTVTDD